MTSSENTTGAGTGVVSGMERKLAVSHWLLSATDDVPLARSQWMDAGGVALLSCGSVFSAVRMPAHLVWAAAGTEELVEVDAFLRQHFTGGAVFMDLHSHHYYALVPASSAWKWKDREHPGVDCLGRDHFLGVPAVTLTEPRGRAYWCVPMDSPGDLTYLDEVEGLVRQGRDARAAETRGVR